MTPMLLAPLPVMVVLLLVVIATVPWGGPDWLEMALALLTVGAVYYWNLKRPRLMPAVLVFALGMILDVLTQGPLGVWTAAALVAGLSGRLVRRSQVRFGRWQGAALGIVTLALVATLVAAVTSLYGRQLVALEPVVDALLAACLAYPVLSSLLSLLDGLWPVVDGRSLFMRGD